MKGEDCVNAFQTPAQDETLWSFMASVKHLANILKPEQLGVTVKRRHRHTVLTSNAMQLQERNIMANCQMQTYDDFQYVHIIWAKSENYCWQFFFPSVILHKFI